VTAHQPAAASPRQPIDFELAPEAACAMRSHIQKHPGLEHAWIHDVDWDRGMLVNPRLRRRGSPTRVDDCYNEMTPGQVFLHSHPNGILAPSDNDIDSAREATAFGIAFGVVTLQDDRVDLLLVTPPRRPPPTSYPTWSRKLGPFVVSIMRLPSWMGRR